MSGAQPGSRNEMMTNDPRETTSGHRRERGKKPRVALALLLATGVPVYVACQGSGGGMTAATDTSTASELLRVPVSNQREKPFEEFNRQAREAAARGDAWPRDPILLTRQFSGRHSERVGAWSMEGSGERPSRYRIVAISDGFLDDSVRGERLEVLLTRGPDEVWQIAEARTSVRCWEDRGHQDFSGEPCQ
jgi:hypothetical protein